ncbi:hypothetical protein HY844_01450 [Candidatus Berkelbacteria bacterium]|nr:hypothetical protein [Candidatus Berkelbacteria bacterium]
MKRANISNQISDKTLVNQDLVNWQTKSIYFQLGNIGSEIGRALKWKNKNYKLANSAAERALELLDWTLSDKQNIDGLKEIARIREVFADSFYGDNQYNQTAQDWDRYFYCYSLAANSK